MRYPRFIHMTDSILQVMSLVVPIVDIFSFEFQKNILEINIRPRLASVGSFQAHFVKNMQAPPWVYVWLVRPWNGRIYTCRNISPFFGGISSRRKVWYLFTITNSVHRCLSLMDIYLLISKEYSRYRCLPRTCLYQVLLDAFPFQWRICMPLLVVVVVIGFISHDEYMYFVIYCSTGVVWYRSTITRSINGIQLTETLSPIGRGIGIRRLLCAFQMKR